ncbi:ICAM1 protein, partial [Pardalotus punctatus]|nr:ICAM1 protein [Pardalotus punctatus]
YPSFPSPYPTFPSPYPTFPGPHPAFPGPYSTFPSPYPTFPAVRPWLDDAGCPRQQNWTEGQEGTLECRAGGKPEPRVRCSKDGNSLAAGVARPVHRSHAGTYLCQASNALGTAERNVTVEVLCESGASGLLEFWGSRGYWDSW